MRGTVNHGINCIDIHTATNHTATNNHGTANHDNGRPDDDSDAATDHDHTAANHEQFSCPGIHRSTRPVIWNGHSYRVR